MARISRFVTRTPFHNFETANLFIKREDLQNTGSFKIRGVANKILIADDARRESGLVTISTGNTGVSLCHIGRSFSVPVHVFVLENCESSKVNHLLNMGATIHRTGRSTFAGSVEAREFADQHGMLFCSSCADWDFVHGVGTVGLEVIEEHPDLDILLVPIGGGGLGAGVGTVYSVVDGIKKPRIIGVQPEGSRPIYDYFHYGRIVAEPFNTVADCLAGDPEDGTIILNIAQSILADIVLVSDSEIVLAAKRLASSGIAVEPGAAAAYAAYLTLANAAGAGRGTADEKIGVILTGASMTTRDFTGRNEAP